MPKSNQNDKQLDKSDQEAGNPSSSNEDEWLNTCKPSQTHSTFRKIFEFVFVICDLDFFLIYKGGYPQANYAKYSIFRSSASLIGRNNYVCQRINIRVPFLILVCYLMIKYLVMSTIQIIDIILIEQHSLVYNVSLGSNTSPAPMRGFLLLDLARKTMPKYYQTAFEHVFKIGNFVNSSFWSLSTDQTILQIILAIAVLYNFIILPRICRKNPMDAPNLRFMLEPSIEIGRLDSIIKQQIEIILSERSKSKLTSMILDQATDLRPYTFSAKWHKLLCRYTMFLFFINIYSTLISQIVFYYVQFEIAKGNLCIIRQLNECNYLLVFTKQDIISFLEIFLGLGLSGVKLALIMVVISANNICQLVLIRSVEKELINCLSVVSLSTMYYRESHEDLFNKQKARCTSIRRDSMGKHTDTLASAIYLLKNEDIRRQENVEFVLQRTYIKLVVAIDEMQKTASLIGRSFESFLVLMGLVIVVAFLTNIINGPETRMIQVTLLIIYWSITNPILFACGLVFSRTIRLEKIAWSILAEMSIYQSTILRTGGLRSYSSREDNIEVLVKRWRRLVKSSTLSDRRNSIRSFGMNLTYGLVLRMNFTVITIASLLNSFER